MEKRYFDYPEDDSNADWWIDPNDIEVPEDVYGVMQCGPDWEELYKDGITAWCSEDERYTVYMITNAIADSVEITSNIGGKERTIAQKYTQILCTDCFGELCSTLMGIVKKLFDENSDRITAADAA